MPIMWLHLARQLSSSRDFPVEKLVQKLDGFYRQSNAYVRAYMCSVRHERKKIGALKSALRIQTMTYESKRTQIHAGPISVIMSRSIYTM